MSAVTFAFAARSSGGGNVRPSAVLVWGLDSLMRYLPARRRRRRGTSVAPLTPYCAPAVPSSGAASVQRRGAAGGSLPRAVRQGLDEFHGLGQSEPRPLER